MLDWSKCLLAAVDNIVQGRGGVLFRAIDIYSLGTIAMMCRGARLRLQGGTASCRHCFRPHCKPILDDTRQSSVNWPRLQPIVWLLLTLWASGCHVLDEVRRPRVDSAGGMYDKATITYKLDASRLGEPMALARIEGQLVSYDPQPSSPEAGTALATLKIIYPHPDGLAGFAQAEVTVQSKLSKAMLKGAANAPGTAAPKWKVAGLKEDELDYEIWRCDLPKIELDRGIGSLTESGFFSVGPTSDAGVEVEARMDNVHRSKDWKQVGGLDAIMLRVRRTGQLVSYRRAPSVAGGPRSTSVDAYRSLVGSDGRPVANAGPAAQMAALPGHPPVVSAPAGSGGALMSAPPAWPGMPTVAPLVR
jgi:hypothetical protein